MSKDKMCYFNYIWLQEKFEELNIKPCVFARQAKISTSTISVIMKGEKNPTKRTEKVARGIYKRLEKLGVKDAHRLYDRPGKQPKQQIKSIEEENPIMSHDILKHFGFENEPFKSGIAPPEDFFNNMENEFLVKEIVEGAKQSKFMLIVGDVGSGKSTLCTKVRTILEKEKNIKIGRIPAILMKHADDRHITSTVLRQIGNFKKKQVPQSYEEREITMMNILDSMEESGIHPVFLLDEAHQLNCTVLKDFRLLHEEYSSSSPLGIILFAQPIITSSLFMDSMKEVRDRIEIKEIKSFKNNDKITHDNIKDYINYKLKIAGCEGEIFTPGAISEIARFARTPLGVNIICRKTLKKAFDVGEQVITEEIIKVVVLRRDIKR